MMKAKNANKASNATPPIAPPMIAAVLFGADFSADRGGVTISGGDED